MDNHGDIADLIAQCRIGDDAAHARFYNQFQPFIMHVVAQQLRKINVYHSKSDVEDLTSEMILKISANDYEKLDALRDPKSIQGWLYVVTQNHVVSHVRKEARHDRALVRYARESEERYGMKPEYALDDAEQEQALHESLRALDQQDRLVVTLYYIDKLRYYEIADVLSLNINTVATRLRRAKEKLRTQLLRRKK